MNRTLVIPELLQLIFSYLNVADQKRCMRVNRQWFAILIATHWRTCRGQKSQFINGMERSRVAIYAAQIEHLEIECDDLGALNHVDCPKLKHLVLVNRGKLGDVLWITHGAPFNNLQDITFKCQFLPLGLVNTVLERFGYGGNIRYTVIIADYSLRTAKLRQTFGFFNSNAIKTLGNAHVVFNSSPAPAINKRVFKTLAIFPGITNITIALSLENRAFIYHVIDTFREYAPFQGIRNATLIASVQNNLFVRQLQNATHLTLIASVPMRDMLKSALQLPKLQRLEVDPENYQVLEELAMSSHIEQVKSTIMYTDCQEPDQYLALRAN